jgi:hypothetical protein
MAQLGDVLNKHAVTDVISGPVAASTTLGIGLVYEDGANGWKNAPTDGSIEGRSMYFNPVSIDNSSGSLGDKIGTFYGEGALVVGTADTAIAVDAHCKASTNVAQAFEDVTITTTLGDLLDVVAIYRGKVHERTESGTSRTAAADTDTDCVFQIVRS